MKSPKKYSIYLLSLVLLFFSDLSLAQSNTKQSVPNPGNKENTSKTSVFSAYYNMKIINNSKTAVVSIKRDQYECMYDAGPAGELNLIPNSEGYFKLEDDDNLFHNCNAAAKWVTWNVEYEQPNSEKKYCSVKLLTDYLSMEEGWRTYFYVTPYTDCQIPIKFTCDGNESNCQNGFVSHDWSTNIMEITK
ncbi:hypothetical protein [Xenorhabdus innexi]|uniref:Uncharacterized protein n=1 Tax=Xenorhabdus innexi TaxID=290109 RepID=A0A1N6MRB5_9GAMM|nr:hypothetical protein [Xenorhabdus innexi]PHM30695.1 hypothetical protein Xinn_03206 [Xenorhabdus innexi]SIP71376.1 exported hypothetical protein [Xenorhabdus innexi]